VTKRGTYLPVPPCKTLAHSSKFAVQVSFYSQ